MYILKPFYQQKHNKVLNIQTQHNVFYIPYANVQDNPTRDMTQ